MSFSASVHRAFSPYRRSLAVRGILQPFLGMRSRACARLVLGTTPAERCGLVEMPAEGPHLGDRPGAPSEESCGGLSLRSRATTA